MLRITTHIEKAVRFSPNGGYTFGGACIADD